MLFLELNNVLLGKQRGKYKLELKRQKEAIQKIRSDNQGQKHVKQRQLAIHNGIKSVINLDMNFAIVLDS